MKKTIFKLLACSLAVLAPLPSLPLAGQERDLSFLPEKVAVYGPERESAITRDQAVRLLKSKFTSDQLKVMSEGEIRSAVRILAAGHFEYSVMERLLKEHNITPNPGEMAGELRRLHHSLPPARRRNIEKQLSDDGSDFETYLKKSVNDPGSVMRYAFIQWVERSTVDKITVSDAEAEHFYRLNQGIFLVQETFVLSRIAVPARNDADAIRTRLALGETFASLARQHGGGKYGEFARNELDPEILKAVDPLKAGESGAVVKQPDGWAVFHVDSRVPASFVPLADVKDYICHEIRKAKVLAEVQRLLYAERKELNFELIL